MGASARRRSCGSAVDAIEKTHPYEVEAAIVFLDAASDRDRAAEAAAERLGGLVREQELVGKQPEGYSPGEIHHPHDFAKRPDSLAARWFSDEELVGVAGRARGQAARGRRLADHVGRVDARDRDRVERADDDRGAEDAARLRPRLARDALQDLGVDVEVRVDLVGVVEVLERVDQLHQLRRALLVERDERLGALHDL